MEKEMGNFDIFPFFFSFSSKSNILNCFNLNFKRVGGCLVFNFKTCRAILIELFPSSRKTEHRNSVFNYFCFSIQISLLNSPSWMHLLVPWVRWLDVGGRWKQYALGLTLCPTPPPPINYHFITLINCFTITRWSIAWFTSCLVQPNKVIIAVFSATLYGPNESNQCESLVCRQRNDSQYVELTISFVNKVNAITIDSLLCKTNFFALCRLWKSL